MSASLLARTVLAFAFSAFASFAWPALARDAADAPALWKIAGAKGDVYLFGAVHLLPQGVNWRTPALEAALAKAQVIAFETDLDEAKDPAKMQALVTRLGMLPENVNLRQLFDPAGRAKYENVLTTLSLSAPALDRYRPWFAANMIGVQWVASQGFDLESGVDGLIWNWSRQNGKQTATLETVSDQLNAYAGLTRAQEVAFLLVSLDQIETSPKLLQDIVAAWRKGDAKSLDRLLNEDMDQFPALRDRLLRDRHVKWLPQIEAIIADGRTHVVVVGAAHLVGKGSIIDLLRAKGVKIEGP
jgi:uncharacterized protein